VKRVYLSHFLEPSTPFYGGDTSFFVERLRSIDAGDSNNSSKWSFPNHAGTHIDLPLHFVRNGKSLHEYGPEFWFFNDIGIIDISPAQPGAVIGPEVLEPFQGSNSIELLFLKTGFGRFRDSETYWRESPVFRPELAEHMRARFPFLKVIGFDTISIGSLTERTIGRAAHKAYLGGERPILLVEDMDLSSVGGTTIFSSAIIAPLLVFGADASPCMVVAEMIDSFFIYDS
jgi:kynurenine formamidase